MRWSARPSCGSGRLPGSAPCAGPAAAPPAFRELRNGVSPVQGRLRAGQGDAVSAEEELEQYETEIELKLYKEYRDVLPMFRYVVETERRFYLANEVDMQIRNADGRVYFELLLEDAWVWDMYRPARFVQKVRVVTFRDVNVEELGSKDY
ncbi:MAG: DUF2469 domain-containing protein [Acidimicrobiia bacterium]|nr:DUF2469 domain-containing protein [Acidimicrobiia bacterium]